MAATDGPHPQGAKGRKGGHPRVTWRRCEGRSEESPIPSNKKQLKEASMQANRKQLKEASMQAIIKLTEVAEEKKKKKKDRRQPW
jgi:hypothetical protein